MKLLILLFLANNALAQSQYLPVQKNVKNSKANSFRHAKQIFLIKVLNKDHESYGLEQNEQDYQLFYQKKDQRSFYKLSSKTAEELDSSFVQEFIKLKYSLVKNSKKCKELYQLKMRGESESVCKIDEKRAQVAMKLITKINGVIKQ